jgi:regulator of sigma E protease
MNTVVAIIIIFGALVLFHELGHLLLAKRAGILCREFAIGFGPKIFAFKKGETVYTIRLLPLGGFVRMAGEDPEGIEIKPGAEVGLIFDRDNKVTKIVANQKNKYRDAKIITVEQADIEKELFISGYQQGEQLETYSVHEKAVYIVDNQPTQIAPYNRQFGSKTLMERTLAIFAGPFMNFLLAFVVLTVFAIVQGIPNDDAKLGRIAEDGAAQSAGLQQNDEIISIDGEAVNSWQEVVAIIKANPEQTLQFEIERNGDIETVSVTPEKRESNEEGKFEGYIGAYQPSEFSVTGSLQYGITQTAEWTKLIFVGLGQLITGAISVDNLSGPVGIYEYTDQAAQGGIYVLMQWAAILSINLAIFNLLPLPALDGGRLMFLAVEAVRGKPLDPQKEGLVHFVGFAFLMLLMIVVTWNDIHKFFL